MSETFQPEIKTIEDVSGSVAKTEALHASQTERINLLNSQIGGGKDAKIVTKENKKDLWIRKEKG
jgi:hypothetical protein